MSKKTYPKTRPFTHEPAMQPDAVREMLEASRSQGGLPGHAAGRVCSAVFMLALVSTSSTGAEPPRQIHNKTAETFAIRLFDALETESTECDDAYVAWGPLSRLLCGELPIDHRRDLRRVRKTIDEFISSSKVARFREWKRRRHTDSIFGYVQHSPSLILLDPKSKTITFQYPAPFEDTCRTGERDPPGDGELVPPYLVRRGLVMPEYPETAVLAKIEAYVFLQVDILSTGEVVDVCIHYVSVPHFGFGDAALEAVPQWRFLPATLDGTPIRMTIDIILDFNPN